MMLYNNSFSKTSTLCLFLLFSSFFSPLTVARVNLQQHCHKQLVGQGWREEEHGSTSSCSCLSLCLSLRPLRGPGTIKPTIVPTLDLETFHTTAALTTNSLVVASTNLGGRFDQKLSNITLAFSSPRYQFRRPPLQEWNRCEGICKNGNKPRTQPQVRFHLLYSRSSPIQFLCVYCLPLLPDDNKSLNLQSRILVSFDTATDVHLYAHDNALVMLERR